ncbi:MAG TPA: NYN domain-containing protein [Candidatus Brocadiia bacterium]|nr:NYN domain-containing protein [Candidatus Brocadiia bacterium]
MSCEHLVAVLVDGGFITRYVRKALGAGQQLQAVHLLRLSSACVRTGEELFRIYYYDCPPFDGKARHPLLKSETNFRNKYFESRTRFLSELACSDHVALRTGVLSFNGWKLTQRAVGRLLQGKGTDLEPEDVEPDLRQKCVDMKIGLDVAWLSSKRLVDKIVLVANDRDFIPPMKHARREGVRVVVMEWPGQYRVQPALREHADEVRALPTGRDCIEYV